MSSSQTFAPRCKRVAHIAAFLAATVAAIAAFPVAAADEAISTDQTRPNIIFILSDDHRYDFLGFHQNAPEFLETPNLDRVAREGLVFENAFVSTSICSPSRASILSGQYMHHHDVIDNQRPIPEGTRFYPEALQAAGYRTAFVGKWHMGHDDDSPKPGFDHWVSFRGQGAYNDPTLNINGERVEESGYITDVLTDYALEWMKEKDDRPYALFLSYKAVHFPFTPATRNEDRYSDAKVDYPATMANTESNYRSQPNWVRERRYGIHGVDHMETGSFDSDPVPSFRELYLDYAETVYGIDENLGRVMKAVDRTAKSVPTILFYMGDNGFALGEHGFYDKRDAFETSIRVPLLVYAPGLVAPGQRRQELVQNIDIAPTMLELAGLQAEAQMDGSSLVPLLASEAKEVPWRDHILYEYYWEWNFPATPTTFAIRDERYKYIYYHGIWDRNGFYDLQADPMEGHNLIDLPQYRELINTMHEQLFDEFAASGGLEMPIRPPVGDQYYDRKLRR